MNDLICEKNKIEAMVHNYGTTDIKIIYTTSVIE